jgi:hypothetical protein
MWRKIVGIFGRGYPTIVVGLREGQPNDPNCDPSTTPEAFSQVIVELGQKR